MELILRIMQHAKIAARLATHATARRTINALHVQLDCFCLVPPASRCAPMDFIPTKLQIHVGHAHRRATNALATCQPVAQAARLDFSYLLHRQAPSAHRLVRPVYSQTALTATAANAASVLVIRLSRADATGLLTPPANPGQSALLLNIKQLRLTHSTIANVLTALPIAAPEMSFLDHAVEQQTRIVARATQVIIRVQAMDRSACRVFSPVHLETI